MKSAKKGKVERLWAKSVDQTNDNRFFHMAKLALHLFEVSQIDAAVAVGLEALEHSEILAPELVLMLTHEVGSWLNKDDRFDEAQETLAKSLELCSGESRSYWWAACMWEKGKSWEGLEHSDAALDYLAAAEVFSSLNEDDLAMATYQAAADSHLVRKDFQKTTQVLSVLLEFQREHHFFQQMVSTLIEVGTTLVLWEKWEMAKRHLEEAIAVANHLGLPIDIQIANYHLAILELRRDQPFEATKYLHEAGVVSTETVFDISMRSLKMLHDVYVDLCLDASAADIDQIIRALS